MMQTNRYFELKYMIARFVAVSVIISAAVAVSGHSELQVSFCDLVKNPERYNGKEVTVRATYRYGFEWQYLYCLSCPDRGKVWLEIANDLDDASVKALKRAPKSAGTINLTVHGVFMSGRRYGHENGYQFQFVTHRASNVAVLVKGMNPDKEKQADRQWACGGTNPK